MRDQIEMETGDTVHIVYQSGLVVATRSDCRHFCLRPGQPCRGDKGRRTQLLLRKTHKSVDTAFAAPSRGSYLAPGVSIR